MNQKFKKIAVITLAVLIAGSFGAYKIMDNVYEHKKKEAAMAAGATEWEYDEMVNQKKESGEQTAKISWGNDPSTSLHSNSVEDEVILAMHKMTHQKIKSEEKWGAIPMTPENIEEISILLDSKRFPNGDTLERIIRNWKDGDFTTIVQDHNVLWDMQGGTIGKAYGIMSAEEEAQFIKNNFK